MDEAQKEKIDRAVDEWFADVRATIGPELSTDTFNRLHAMVPDLKSHLAASV